MYKEVEQSVVLPREGKKGCSVSDAGVDWMQDPATHKCKKRIVLLRFGALEVGRETIGWGSSCLMKKRFFRPLL